MKCHDRDVPFVFHGILHVKVHVHMLRETWSMQTRDVNLECLCHVSLRVHACKSEVINERYCTLVRIIPFVVRIIITILLRTSILKKGNRDRK